jgi:hypothetical protein
MVRVCCPGGRILLQDLDGQLVWHYPEDVELQETLGRVMAGLAEGGFDPLVGRKLFSLAKSAGLTDIEVTAESYHLYAGCIGNRNLRLWETKFDIAMPAAAKILGSTDAAQRLKYRFLEYLCRDDTLTYSVLFTVTGTKPSGQPCQGGGLARQVGTFVKMRWSVGIRSLVHGGSHEV